jgi:ribosomal-protein-alanine N-acetyltransferase
MTPNFGERHFDTERLRLEPLCELHAAELFTILSEPRMYRFVPQDPPVSLAILARRFALLETRRSPDGTEAWLNWVLRSKPDGVCLGSVQVTVRRDGRAQLAYDLGVPYWGQGFATEACRCVIKALFEDGIAEVWAELDTRNEASQRLLERLGFRRGALRRNADVFKGADSDEWTYSLTRATEVEQPHKIEIRNERIDSSPAKDLILALNAELSERYAEDGTMEHFRLEPGEVAPGRGAFLVVYVSGKPRGCGAIRLINPDTAEVKRMYVEPSARGLGLGRRVLDSLEAEARALGERR